MWEKCIAEKPIKNGFFQEYKKIYESAPSTLKGKWTTLWNDVFVDFLPLF